MQPHSGETIASRFDPRNNALNALRLVLALLVIVSHSQPIGGFGQDPRLGDLNLGSLAVGGFFAVSGYLITASRFQGSFLGYCWRRARRIMPGFWVCLLVTAFIAAPIAGCIRGGWSAGNAAEYVVRQALLYRAGAISIGDTLIGAPYASTWNGSLWTLFYEGTCYLLVGVLMLSAAVRRHAWLTIAGFVLSTAASASSYALGTPGTLGLLVTFLPWFLAGAILLLYADQVPLTATGAAVAASLLAATMIIGVARVLGAMPVAYLCFWISVALPGRLRRVCTRNDVSYGMYLYAFPIQQTLFVLGAQSMGAAVFTLLSIGLTVPVAWVSWTWVEKPALRSKPRVLRLLRTRIRELRGRLSAWPGYS